MTENPTHSQIMMKEEQSGSHSMMLKCTTNEYVENNLNGLGAKMIKPVSYCKVSDRSGNETPFINGYRYYFAEPTHTTSHRLPQGS